MQREGGGERKQCWEDDRREKKGNEWRKVY
jgi:hypothetical protein